MDKASNFRYKPVDGGFEIHNGTYPHTRPLYAPHIRDDGRHRYLYFVGDQPDVAASMATAGKRTPKLGNLFLALRVASGLMSVSKSQPDISGVGWNTK